MPQTQSVLNRLSPGEERQANNPAQALSNIFANYGRQRQPLNQILEITKHYIENSSDVNSLQQLRQALEAKDATGKNLLQQAASIPHESLEAIESVLTLAMIAYQNQKDYARYIDKTPKQPAVLGVLRSPSSHNIVNRYRLNQALSSVPGNTYTQEDWERLARFVPTNTFLTTTIATIQQVNSGDTRGQLNNWLQEKLYGQEFEPGHHNRRYDHLRSLVSEGNGWGFRKGSQPAKKGLLWYKDKQDALSNESIWQGANAIEITLDPVIPESEHTSTRYRY